MSIYWLEICSEQTVHILYPPDKIHFYRH